MNQKHLKLEKKNKLFALMFENYLRTFILDNRLIPTNKKMLIAVSGGVDSIALAHAFYSLGFAFEILHFNHGTRKNENKKEENIVVKWAGERNIKLHLYSFDLTSGSANFESKAREKRLKIYKDFIANNYWVYTAHHLNDSFEWSLMQMLRQSSPKKTLGIPLFNHGLVRPFLCVSKDHILRYARASNISWLEDSSNKNLNFERNFLREKIISELSTRYNKFLKHYASRHNQLAFESNLLRKRISKNCQITKEQSGGVVFQTESLRAQKEKIREFLHLFSSKRRGEIDDQLMKLIVAHEHILSDKKAYPSKGPIHFSGGACAHLLKNVLFIGGQNTHIFYQKLDLELVKFFTDSPQIPKSTYSPYFPYLIVDPNGLTHKSSKLIHPLLPKTCEYLKLKKVTYTFAPLIEANVRQKFIRDALILDSSFDD